MKPDVGMKLDVNWYMKTRVFIMAVGVVTACAVRAEDLPAGLEDPTRPPMVSAGKSGAAMEYHSGPVLQSTFISSSSRRAVISGRSYGVGDKMDNAVIEDIQPYEVVLKQGARETRLRLLPKLAKEVQILQTGTRNEEGRNK
jgi:MSHA biogenesis protein MshK